MGSGTPESGEGASLGEQKAESRTSFCRGVAVLRWAKDFGGPRLRGTASGDAVPGGVRHRRVASRDSTVLGEQPSPNKECGRPVATAPPRTMSRLETCLAKIWEILLRPCGDEGRNTILGRSWCLRSWLVRTPRGVGLDLFRLSYILIFILEVAGYGCCP